MPKGGPAGLRSVKPEVVHAAAWGDPSKHLPYVVVVPEETLREEHLEVEAPCLSMRLRVMTVSAHTVAEVIVACLQYRQLLVTKKKKGILGPCALPLKDLSLFHLAVRGKKGPLRLSPSHSMSHSSIKSHVRFPLPGFVAALIPPAEGGLVAPRSA